MPSPRRPSGRALSHGPGSKRPKPPKAQLAPLELVQLPPVELTPVGSWVRRGMDEGMQIAQATTWAERGRLRGGSVGVFLPTYRSESSYEGSRPEYTGACIRKAAARFLGAEPPRDTDKWRDTLLMLEQGAAVEELFAAALESGLPAGWRVEREFAMRDEIAGQLWTGREDLAIVDSTGTARCLIELKNVSSLPHELLLLEQPKLDHVIQLANYMRVSGLPGQLWYTSRSVWPIPNWSWVTAVLPESPQSEAPGSQYVEWGRGGTQASKISPFMIGFHVRIADDGSVVYTRAADFTEGAASETPEVWAKTPITVQGLLDYYTAVAAASRQTSGRLPPPPVTMDVNGRRKNYSPCDYCDWSIVCGAVGDSVEHWRAAVESQAGQGEAAACERGIPSDSEIPTTKGN